MGSGSEALLLAYGGAPQYSAIGTGYNTTLRIVRRLASSHVTTYISFTALLLGVRPYRRPCCGLNTLLVRIVTAAALSIARHIFYPLKNINFFCLGVMQNERAGSAWRGIHRSDEEGKEK